MIEVVKPGLSTTVQDAGRTGYYHLGIPPSGALDQYALRAANLLVGNPAGAAALECVYMGPELGFTADAVVAVAGASMVPKVDGEERPLWESFPVSAGEVLSFGYLTAGARAYIAVSGGIDVPEVLGSRSTYALGALGGYYGRPLAAGDRLPVGTSANNVAPGRGVPADLRQSHPKDVEVRVVMGLYDHRLTDAGRSAFLDTTWALTPVADRIGFRYSGTGAGDRAARAPVRRRAGSVEHRRRALPDRVDPGAGQRRADHPAPRRRLRRRLHDDRDRAVG